MSTLEHLPPSRRFSRIVNRLAQLIDEIETIRTLERLASDDVPPAPQREHLDVQLPQARRLLDYLEAETVEALRRGNPIRTGVSERVQQRYDYIFTRRQRIRQAEFAVMATSIVESLPALDTDPHVTNEHSEKEPPDTGVDSGDADPDESDLNDSSLRRQTSIETPIRHTIQTWVEGMEDLVESGEITLSPEQFRGVLWAVHADWFTPDAWYAASRDSRLLVLSREHDELPTWVNHRVKDLYRALLTGNYLAALALARATLESALDHRADSLLKNLNRKTLADLRRQRKTGLGDWLPRYEQAGVNLPYTEIHEDVRKRGNEALHGLRKDDTIGPVRAAEPVLRAIEVTVRAIEQLYRP